MHNKDQIVKIPMDLDREMEVNRRLEEFGPQICFFPEVYACICAGDIQHLERSLNEDVHNYFDNIMNNLEIARISFFCLMGICMFMADQAGLLVTANETVGRYYTDRLKECADTKQIKALTYNMMREFTIEIQRVKTESSSLFLLQRCRAYVKNHIYENITATNLAQICNMSLSTLERHLKEECGYAPRQIIREEKIRKACFLLANTELPYIQISALLNFCSQSYFVSCFKQAIGQTPSFYRMQCRKA